ncbi:hypothetical protein ANCCAN_01278 [Ancylostoma caninum]|uniref:Uncharacterized protein n=1 Tax=Ancylostoma caninum TaxID=29170 RepID=A0A368HAD0_ANCCA|nr:hypothetical protein ANCCAN_01278 [Ancylostoma caninum]
MRPRILTNSPVRRGTASCSVLLHSIHRNKCKNWSQCQSGLPGYSTVRNF